MGPGLTTAGHMNTKAVDRTLTGYIVGDGIANAIVWVLLETSGEILICINSAIVDLYDNHTFLLCITQVRQITTQELG